MTGTAFALHGHRRKQALEELQLAEAELAVLKEEQVLRELLSTGEPTAEVTERLRQLRVAAQRLSTSKKEPQFAEDKERREDAA